MANSTLMKRQHPLAGSAFATGQTAITLAPDAFRMSLRADDGAIASLERALGVKLPRKPKTSVTRGTRSALWLGPDEWIVIDSKSDPNAAAGKAKGLFSAVDISHRNTGLLVSGDSAADVINAGCPQDLSPGVFPVGAASRTVFGKVEVVLWRTKPTVFRIEVWRSFSRYALDLLEAAARDAG